MTTVVLFVFGLIIGSFLNVLSLRFNSGISLSGRSKCPHCGKVLRFYELIPVVSFFLSGRRCRECRALISWQYPLVELWTGLVFATLYNPESSYVLNALLLFVFSLYIAITVYDLRHKIIPNQLVYLCIILAATFRLWDGGEALDYFSGPLVATFFFLIWFFSQERAMGFGDVKLILSVGFLLGAAVGFSAVVLSFWIGAVVGIGMLIRQRFNPLSVHGKQITIKSEVPFAPFIVLGSWLALWFNLDILNVSIF